MSEVYSHPLFPGDVIQSLTNEIVIPEPHLLIDAIERYDGTLYLLKNSAPGENGKDYGRYKSTVVFMNTDYTEQRRQALVQCNVLRRGIDLKQELIQLEYRLTHGEDASLAQSSVVLNDKTLIIRRSAEQFLDIELTRRPENPFQITFEMTADMVFENDPKGVYAELQEIFGLLGKILDVLAPMHEYNGLATSPKFPIHTLDYAMPEIHENDLRFATLLREIEQRYSATSTRIPDILYDQAEIIQLGRDFPNLPLDAVEWEITRLIRAFQRLDEKVKPGRIGHKELRLILEKLAKASS